VVRDLLGTRGQAQSATINVMVQAALKAARGLVRDFGEIGHLQVSKKGPADFVSSADLKADRLLREELQKARPNYGFLTEEGEDIQGSDPTARWIIDPLDGTTNFLHGIPHFAISIALEKDDDIVAGVIYDPIKDELFYAEKGMGTYLNNKRIRISDRKVLSECLMATGIPFRGHGNGEKFIDGLLPIMQETSGVRRLGAAALDLAYVAAGRFDGYWERDLSPWDIAAGILLVREAGGFVTDFASKPVTPFSNELIATSPHLHGSLLKLIKRA
jgi:myo-inositol-1(or 4)-monophosphatase